MVAIVHGSEEYSCKPIATYTLKDLSWILASYSARSGPDHKTITDHNLFEFLTLTISVSYSTKALLKVHKLQYILYCTLPCVCGVHLPTWFHHGTTLLHNFLHRPHCNSTHSYIMLDRGGGSILALVKQNIVDALYTYAEAIKLSFICAKHGN